MKVAFFLEPFPIRQDPSEIQYAYRMWAPHLEGLARYGSSAVVLCSDLLAKSACVAQWISPEQLGFAPYQSLDRLSCDLEWVELMRNPVHPRWRPIVDALLERARPDGVVTWTLNAPLKAACAERRIPLVHQELGPLRAPFPPLYFSDPLGVNGESAVPRVWKHVRSGPWSARHEAELGLFEAHCYRPQLQGRRAEFGQLGGRQLCAVFLQMPRDSNVLAFSRVDGNEGLLRAVAEAAEPSKVQLVVKPHPYDRREGLVLPPGAIWAGANTSAGELIAAADAVVTINSSVGLEALLQKKPVFTFGQSAYSGVGATRDIHRGPGELAAFLRGDLALTAEEDDARKRLLHFLLFRYFVSWREFNDPGWFLQTMERHARLVRRSSPLEDYFAPSTVTTRLREHLTFATSRRELDQLNETIRLLEQRSNASEAEVKRLLNEVAALERSLGSSHAAANAASSSLAALENSAGMRVIRGLQKAPLLYPTWLAAKKRLGRLW